MDDLEQELRDAIRRAHRAELERDEYREQLHLMATLKSQMSSAAIMAAGTAEAALRRILRMEPVVTAAIAFNADPNRINLKFALDEAVEKFLESEPS